MIGLGIESTCDETSLALVEDGNRNLVCRVYSQIPKHAAYGGVVPEIASRAHLEKMNSILDSVLSESGVDWLSLSYVAVANRPGLLGSLMMGAQMARCISLVHRLPIVAVDHLEAHLGAVFLESEEARKETFPYLGILLSGGNSSIYLYRGWGDMVLLADTLDDALGEAFDKASKILDLGYPGGPRVESRANEYARRLGESHDQSPGLSYLPRLLKADPQEKIQFSFSGLKTAILYARRDNPQVSVDQLAYEFQETSFELVVRNLRKAVQRTGIRTILAGGGVLANETLRRRLDGLRSEGIRVFYPQSRVLCTDNGAMVAALGYNFFTNGIRDSMDFRMSPKRNSSRLHSA